MNTESGTNDVRYRLVHIAICIILVLLSGVSGSAILAQQPAESEPAGTPGYDAGPQVWLEFPLDGQVLLLQPIVFEAYAADPQGIAQVDLRVNAETLPQTAPSALGERSGNHLVLLKQEWQPSREGEYVVEARARNAAGTYGEPSYVKFCIGSCKAVQTPTPSPAPAQLVVPTNTPFPALDPYTPTPAPFQVIATNTPKPALVAPTFTPSPGYDLYVRRMDYVPPNPNVGDAIQMAIMLATDFAPQGAPYFPASSFRWRQGPAYPWVEEACPANTQYASCLKNVTFSYAQPGSYVFEVQADHLGQVAETDEANNAKTWTIVVGQQPPTPTFTPAPGYDLYVRRMDFTPPNPNVGDTIQMGIMLATDFAPQGAPYFPASSFRWRPGPAFTWVEETCPANTQYASCLKNVTFSYPNPGSYVFEVQADHLSQVAETDETNNNKTWTITVGQAAPAEQISFRSDAPYVNGGGCTVLRWDVEGVQAVYLNGTGVGGHGSQEVCPCEATTYTLEVVKRDGSRESRQIFIDVYGQCGGLPGPSETPGGEIFTPIEPPSSSDTSGPDISNAGIEVRDCQLYGHANVSDPTGVSWAQFHFRLDGGDWQSLWMADRGGGYWETEFGAQGLGTGGSVEFYVLTADYANNQNEGGNGSDSFTCGINF